MAVSLVEARPLPFEFYSREPVVVARELLGKLLLRKTSVGLCGGRIVEVEAYLASRDSACHASRGMTRRNASMFGPPGRAYVYMIHSRWCLNAVTQPEGVPSAILIRAIEPLVGMEVMQKRRRTDIIRDLARGPARLCEALGVTKALDAHDLTLGRQLWIAGDPSANRSPPRIGRSGRIGVTSAHHRLLRFYLMESPFVSGRRKEGRLARR